MYNIKLSEEQLRIVSIALRKHRYIFEDTNERARVDNISEAISKQHDEQRESVEAFDKAITAGLLSNDINADNYAGRYMYMGKHSISNFSELVYKHRMTRKSISLQIPL